MEEFDQKIPLNSKKTYENDTRFSKCVCTVRNFHAQFGRFVRFKHESHYTAQWEGYYILQPW